MCYNHRWQFLDTVYSGKKYSHLERLKVSNVMFPLVPKFPSAPHGKQDLETSL